MKHATKRPGQCANTAEPRSNPQADEKMNDVQTTTSSVTDPAHRDLMSCEVDMTKLRSMSMKQLHDFRNVLHTIGEVTAAFACQPRFSNERSKTYNAAGDLVEDLCQFLGMYEHALVSVAREATPSPSSEVEWRAWTILSHEADCADELIPFAVHAAEAVRDEAEAKCMERYAAIGAAK
ncbi:hypothetical protein CN186_22855 [Sinorhizobium medicae]|uniref:hypothetical protein n=1 Tax=Sinorhizobium medicae TaxID=110321 RepID=UPI000FD6C390|nr:hypothetical protein [Sinorhizobium medicae]RVI90794.1 hypothetical protein CN186_22855 [Sinorhizobium medicae]